MPPPDTLTALHVLEGTSPVPRVNGNGRPSFDVTFTDTKPPKLVLPDVPAHDDLAGHRHWLTCVLRLDPQHPVTGAVHEGRPGPEGHVVIRRAGAPAIRFEPAATVNTARRFLPVLAWQLQPTDGEPYGFKDEHARRIGHVLLLLCGANRETSETEEATNIVDTYVSAGVSVEGHTTYGTGAQRFEAAVALQRPIDDFSGRPIGPARYLIDVNTGELVIRVSDLQASARTQIGSSLPHGWLDARMQNLGWDRRRLDGHAVDGREGRHSPHARTLVYRGQLAGMENPDAA